MRHTVASACGVNWAAVHAVHWCAPLIDENFPAGQKLHPVVKFEAFSRYLPGVQASQPSLVLAFHRPGDVKRPDWHRPPQSADAAPMTYRIPVLQLPEQMSEPLGFTTALAKRPGRHLPSHRLFVPDPLP